MLHRPLITWLFSFFKHPSCVPPSLYSIFRRIFISIKRFVQPFRYLFAVLHAAPPTTSQNVPTPKRKALLVGICGTSLRCNTLKGPHTDVNSMRTLLLDVYNYAPDDIKVLLDDEDPDHIQPTKINVLKAIDDLVRDARPGDRFCFHFAGHAGQTPTQDPGEEDGMDEFIVASDGKKILDDTLNERLVKPLPPNSTLTAVMDSCHSCSLLDLKHHRCNRVFVPWISKGKRKTKTLWYLTVRKPAMWMSAHFISDNTPLPSTKTLFGSTISAQILKPRTPLSILTFTNVDEAEPFVESPVEQYASPKDPFCDGWCRDRASGSMDEYVPVADVVCLSSSQDSQETWETAEGVSMSQILIDFLRKDPNPILSNMMSHITHVFLTFREEIREYSIGLHSSFTIHGSYLDLHSKAREHKKNMAVWRANQAVGATQDDNSTMLPMHRLDGHTLVRPVKKKKKSLGLEMVNFQDPQLSSPFPLDMTRKWTM